jgi:hypothetical protein
MSQLPYAAAKRVFWIVDNGSSHRGAAAVKRLESLEYAGLDSKVFGENDYDVSHASSYFRRLEYEDDDRDY